MSGAGATEVRWTVTAPATTGLMLRGLLPDGTAIELRIPSAGELLIGRTHAADLTVPDDRVSRRHAQLIVTAGTISVRDLSSTNGTYVNGDRTDAADLSLGDRLRVGDTTLMLVSSDESGAAAPSARSEDGTIVLPPTAALREATILLEPVAAPRPSPPQRGVVTDEMLSQPVISEQELISNGVEVHVVPCLSIGGGMGSFVWTDLLRVSGLPASAVAVVSNEETAYGRYRRLCVNSQIPPHERLRSNSDSRPDNVWGFPGYGAAEATRALLRGNLREAARIYWAILGEPAFAQTYTPRSGEVFAAIDREGKRIGWPQMVRFGRARAIRKTTEGRLLVVASISDDQTRKHYAVSAQFAHLSMGYPAIQLLPDLAAFRDKFGDRTRVVNAYENHDHVYESLRQTGGTVLLRGRGIVASRLIQRFYEERQRGTKVTVVHLHRSRLTAGHSDGRSRRTVEDDFEFQPFNWPKSCWTGEQRVRMEAATPEERARLLEVWGGTTTADRRDWKRMVRSGINDGWYRPEYGVVQDMSPAPDGRVITHITNSLQGGGTLELPADYVIDCTGLIAQPERSPILDDLVTTYGLAKNRLGRLQVSNDFEVEGMRHGSAHMFAAGATTLGGPHAAVDSFLGLQYAAYRAVHAMHRLAPKQIRNLNGLYSFRQWLRWARGVAP